MKQSAINHSSVSEIEKFLIELGFKKIGSWFQIIDNKMSWLARFLEKELHIVVCQKDTPLSGPIWNSSRGIEYVNGIESIAEMMQGVHLVEESFLCARPEIPDCVRYHLIQNRYVFLNKIKLTQNEFCQPEEDISTQSSS